MLDFHSGSSDAVNTKKAMHSCIETAMGSSEADTALLILHCTMGHKFDQLLSTAREVCPKAEIVGCTGSGVIGTGWVSEAMRSLAAMAITGDEFTVVSHADLSDGNSLETARDCARNLAAKDPNVNMVLVLGAGLSVNGEGIIRGVEEVFGPDVPLFGALGGFSGNTPRTPVFHNERVYDDGLVLVGFSDASLSLVQRSHHGCLAQDDYRFTITKSDGVRVDELNNKPAWPTLIGSLGLPPDTSPMDIILLLGLGVDLPETDVRHYDNKQILRAPLALSDDGQSMYLQTEVPMGTELVSCQRDEDYLFSGCDGLIDRLWQDIGEREPVAMFHSDCMARGRMGHEVVDKQEFTAKLQQSFLEHGNLPWLGVFGFAEFAAINGKNQFHNYTTSLSAIVRNTAPDSGG